MRITVLLILSFLPLQLLAQDTLHVGIQFETENLNLDLQSSYVHYQEFNDGRLLPVSLKTIEITENGPGLLIKQKEYSSRGTKSLETVVDRTMLQTSTHVRVTGETQESFKFGESTITGDPSDEKSINKDFRIDLVEATFNFEIDFIFLQSIDWEKHEEVVMNFYHPGGNLEPAFYTFKKLREETIVLASGVDVETWVIFTDYNGQPPALFWISKDENEVIRNETDALEVAGFKFIKRLIKS